jgi:hypothetical protein
MNESQISQVLETNMHEWMNESQISQVLETNMNEWMNESQIKVVRGKSSDFKISLPIMVPPIEQSDKKNSDLFREIYTRRRRRTLSVKHSILKWSKHFFFPSLGRLINGIKVMATTLSPSHTHTHKHVYIYIYIHTDQQHLLRQSANMGGGHIPKRKKQTNKVDLISNMSPTPERKKKLLLPLLYKVHGTWGGGNTQLDFGHIWASRTTTTRSVY